MTMQMKQPCVKIGAKCGRMREIIKKSHLRLIIIQDKPRNEFRSWKTSKISKLCGFAFSLFNYLFKAKRNLRIIFVDSFVVILWAATLQVR